MKWIISSLLGVILLSLSPAIGGAASPSDGGSGVIVEQNLFHPNRSIPPPPPALKPVAQPVPPPPPPPKFELAGIVKVEGETSMALLQEPQLTQGKPVVLNLGDSLGGYKLVGIEDDRVRLESEIHKVTVLLHDPTKTPKTAAAARQLATPQPVARPTATRLRAPALQAPPAPEQPAASAESPPVDQDMEPNEAAKQENPIVNVFEKAFGALAGQERIPIFTGRPRRGQ